jgi:hypothetical protein
MQVLWWVVLLVCLLSSATMLLVRSTGYTSTAREGDKYYLLVRSERYETTREEYDATRWRNGVSGVAAAGMLISLLAFVGLEAVRYRVRRRA